MRADTGREHAGQERAQHRPGGQRQTDSPESSTDLVTHCAPRATAICATPQPIVARLATRISVSSSALRLMYFI